MVNTIPSTVTVEVVEEPGILKMTWQRDVREQDVYAAFQKISATLGTTKVPICVIVDLLSNPRFPLRATIEGARGPYSHPLLREWLVIGSNWLAHAVERTLASITNKKNVHWFKSEDEVMAYLDRLKDS